MSTDPWLLVHVPEGFSIEMPAWPARSGSEEERAEGHLKATTYNAKAPPFSCLATIREGTAITSRSPRELVESWKAEYTAAMQGAGLAVQLADERILFGTHSGWDLTFERPEAGTLTRARLIRDHHRLIALVAIGPREQVQGEGERYLKSFKLHLGLGGSV